jgi:hypothetical protein
MAIEIVDFPIKNGGSFHSCVNVYQAGYIPMGSIPTGHGIIPWTVRGPELLQSFTTFFQALLKHLDLLLHCLPWTLRVLGHLRHKR